MRLNLDEHQTNLIREHMHIGICIEELKRQMTKANSIQKQLIKLIGSTLSERLKVIKIELRQMGLHTWHEEQEDMVYITVAYRGIKERFGLKRKIVDEDIQKMLDGFATWIENNQPPHEPYKIDPFEFPIFFAK